MQSRANVEVQTDAWLAMVTAASSSYGMDNLHHEGTKDAKGSSNLIPNFVLFVSFVVKGLFRFG